jgi:antitoxin (DNA-binding transcriptional repressor) of toxin-antitoxin stability system
MAIYTIEEAADIFEEIVDRALKGEQVMLTRCGQPVAEVRPVAASPRILTDEELDWLAARRAGRGVSKEDAGSLVSRIRDEEWGR